MVRKCVICGLTNSAIVGDKNNVTFHSFPTNEKYKKLWLDACNLSNVSKQAKVCSRHFTTSSYKSWDSDRHRVLEQNAVPILFIGKERKYLKRLQKRCQSSVQLNSTPVENTSHKYTTENAIPVQDKVEEKVCYSSSFIQLDSTSYTENTLGQCTMEDAIPVQSKVQEIQEQIKSGKSISKAKKVWRPSRIGDVKEEHFSNPQSAKQCFDVAIRKVLEYKKRLDASRKQIGRLKLKVQTFEDLILKLQDEQLLSENAANILLTTGSDSFNNIVKRHLSGGKKAPFSTDLKKFAVTLHFYSPRAYAYVRKSFNNLLPNERTIRKWYEVVDGKPGFTRESFNCIRQKVQEGIVIINVVIDEMAIRQHVHWNGYNYSGFVNMGSDSTYEHDNNNNNLHLAKNALVLLAVALNSHWKIPLGYFLIDGLDSKQRANLLKTCFSLLHDTECHVHSITFDGAPVNKSMCTQLGASFVLTNSCTFSHPETEEDVFIFLDPCHDLKLIRNALGELGILINERGEFIKWDYIVQLYYKEKVEGLRAATKLTGRHINFHNEKMNVRLAAQVFSESVSKALIYCVEKKYNGKNIMVSKEL